MTLQNELSGYLSNYETALVGTLDFLSFRLIYQYIFSIHLCTSILQSPFFNLILFTQSLPCLSFNAGFWLTIRHSIASKTENNNPNKKWFFAESKASIGKIYLLY